MRRKYLSIILCLAMLLSFFAMSCNSSANADVTKTEAPNVTTKSPEDATDVTDVTTESSQISSPDGTTSTENDAGDNTTESPNDLDTPTPTEPIRFSSSKAPTSLPGSNTGIEGVFVADFENNDDYFQAEAKGGVLNLTYQSDGSVKMFGDQYCSKALIEAGSSGSKALNLYARQGQNMSMRSHFYVKNKHDLSAYSGVMLYIDTSKVVSPNSNTIPGIGASQKICAVSVQLYLTKTPDNAITVENYTEDLTNGYLSMYNGTKRSVKAYYYDSESGKWIESTNELAHKHVILVPAGFAGYVYVPLESYYDGSASIFDKFEEGYVYPARVGVYTGGYNNTEPNNVYITVDDISFVRAVGATEETPEDIVRVDDPNGQTATVRFVVNKLGGPADASYVYSIGKTIYSSDIPKTSNVGNFVFNCWTSDASGLKPCNPEGYKIEGDVTFYGSWFDNTLQYASDTSAIEMRDGGVYNLPKGKIIFYGASNFTRWTTLERDMALELDALNHGIGGATDASLIEHLDRLVLRYEPRAVVIQCSNNDVAKYPDEQCKLSKQQLYNRIHSVLPDTVVIFVSHMPLPSRTEYWKDTQRLQNLNVWVKEFCDQNENCEYLDVYDAILEIANAYLSGNTGAYFNDSSHFNAGGQAKFCAALKPGVLQILAKLNK